jgi:hypothetical protein
MSATSLRADGPACFSTLNWAIYLEATMETPEIHQQRSPIQQIDPIKGQANTSAKAQAQPITPISDRSFADVVKMPSQERIRMSMHERAKGPFQEIAQQIHKIDQDMETIDTQLDGMLESLETIVKQYPPYPAESAERIDNLRRFSALRQMIDQLTFPRQNDAVAKAPPGGNQSLGMEKMAIPKIDPNASDDQILETLNTVKIAQSKHQLRREEFLAVANRILDQIG